MISPTVAPSITSAISTTATTTTNASSTSTPTSTSTSTPTSTPPVSKGRKGAAAGGGKAWTADEEVYLLQMRLERVAYKKIASKLDKTELACRLHYHQLSHGGNRRKRNNSISSNSSTASAHSPATSPAGPSATPSSKSFIAPSFSPVNAAGAVQKPGTPVASQSKIKGKPLLPKPADGPSSSSPSPASSSSSSPSAPSPASGSGAGMIASPRRQTAAKGTRPLRVHCNPDSIDKEKLKRLVKANEPKFWEAIADQYGGGIEGEYLRTIWQKGLGSDTPPTPAISPASQATSPLVAEMSIDNTNNDSPAAASVSEASTPLASAPVSPTTVAFQGSEVASIREEPMDQDDDDDGTVAPTTTTMTAVPAVAKQSPILEPVQTTAVPAPTIS